MPYDFFEDSTLSPSNEQNDIHLNKDFVNSSKSKEEIDPNIQTDNDDKTFRLALKRSWEKSIALKIDRDSPPETRLSPDELSRRQEAKRELISTARSVLDPLALSIKESGYTLMISDTDCYIIDIMDSSAVSNIAQSSFLRLGCLRSIDVCGTTSIGLCKEELRPVQVTGDEHYNKQLSAWTCSTAPIIGLEGELQGMFTLAGKSNQQHAHTFALAKSVAKLIEVRLHEKSLLNRLKDMSTISATVGDLNTMPIIVIKANMQVSFANTLALHMFGKKSEELISKILTSTVAIPSELKKRLMLGNSFSNVELKIENSFEKESYLCSADPIHDSENNYTGMMLVFNKKVKSGVASYKHGGNYARYGFHDIKGQSAKLHEVLTLAKMVAPVNTRVLLTGESGTGKELFAHAIHNMSPRQSEPFVAISCAAIPAELLEAELFGYKGGAFTGAQAKGMIGKFELANKGTLFLDEINSMPIELQAKLLRVLQMNEVTRLGDTVVHPIDVRIIAATNVSLAQEVKEKKFREDLYYRINVMEILIPPLRERIDDIPILIEEIISQLAYQNRQPIPHLHPEALDLLCAYTWPGNVRELNNVCERLFITSQGKTIMPEHLPVQVRYEQRNKQEHALTQILNSQEQYVQQNTYMPDTSFSKQRAEDEELIKLLNLYQGNISRVAEELHIARTTLYRRMKKLGISFKKNAVVHNSHVH